MLFLDWSRAEMNAAADINRSMNRPASGCAIQNSPIPRAHYTKSIQSSGVCSITIAYRSTGLVVWKSFSLNVWPGTAFGLIN